MMPALIVAPALPGRPRPDPVAGAGADAAARPAGGEDRRRAPAADMPTTVPRRMKSRRDSRPAANSSMMWLATAPWPSPQVVEPAMISVLRESHPGLVSSRQIHAWPHRKNMPPAVFIGSLPGCTSQFVDRDVAADQVTRLHLGQRRLGGLADPAGQLARTAGVEHAAARRVGRGRDLAGQPDPFADAARRASAPPTAAPRCRGGAAR